MKKLIFVMAIILLSPIFCFARQKTLHIAVAANFFSCAKEINAIFLEEHKDVDIKLTTGSSGNLFAQIKNGAPFDVFLSANMKYPEQLVKDGFAKKENFIEYVTGKLVLWTKKDNLNVREGLNVLKDHKINKIVIANPKLAPYGASSVAAMEKAEIWELLKNKIVLAENVLQALQYIDTKNADIGFVPLSLLKMPQMKNKGRYFKIPDDMYPKIIQGAVITSYGEKNVLAYEYLKFIKSEKAKNILEKSGYGIPLP